MKFSQIPLGIQFILKGDYNAFGGHGHTVMLKVCLDSATGPCSDRPIKIDPDAEVAPLFCMSGDDKRILSPYGVTSPPPYKDLCGKKLWSVQVFHFTTGDLIDVRVYTTKEKANARAVIDRGRGSVRVVVEEIQLDEPLTKPVYKTASITLQTLGTPYVVILKDSEQYLLLPHKSGEQEQCLKRADEIIKLLERSERFAGPCQK